MNSCECISSAQTSPVPTTPERGFLASLQRLINTADLVSVDLTDTVFASPLARDGVPYEAVERTPAGFDEQQLPERPDHARRCPSTCPEGS